MFYVDYGFNQRRNRTSRCYVCNMLHNNNANGLKIDENSVRTLFKKLMMRGSHEKCIVHVSLRMTSKLMMSHLTGQNTYLN